MYCVVGLQTGFLMLILPCICLIFFLFCKTVQARVVIFVMQVDNDVLYHEFSNQSSRAYFSLYLSYSLSFHTSNNEIFCQRDSVKLCKLELSYEVSRLIMMYCIVGLRAILMLILHCTVELQWLEH